MEENQVLIIDMDDSGQLLKGNPQERVFVYGGVYFLSRRAENDFARQYRHLVNLLKYKYCKGFKEDGTLTPGFCRIHKTQNCKYKCPELKSNMLVPHDRRRLVNFIKRNNNTCVAIVENNNLIDSIFSSKSSRGRYKDYVTKCEVKRIVENLVKEKRIDPNKHLDIYLNLDEQSSQRAGYYNLKHIIKEELQYGIQNFNYSSFVMPVLTSVEVYVKYQDSYKYFPVQAADLIVGAIRHSYYEYIEDRNLAKYQANTSFINTILYLP